MVRPKEKCTHVQENWIVCGDYGAFYREPIRAECRAVQAWSAHRSGLVQFSGNATYQAQLPSCRHSTVS